MTSIRNLLLILVVLLGAACDNTLASSEAAGAAPGEPSSGVAVTGAESTDLAGSPGDSESENPAIQQLESRLGLKVMTEPWAGDFDGMVKRRVIRVLTVYGLGRYFIEDAREQGIVYENMTAFESTINANRKSYERVEIVFIPTSRDRLVPALLEGRGDIIVAGYTITPERRELMDFSNPVSKNIQEIMVTGPTAKSLTSLDDLAGQTVSVRTSSSYYNSLQDLSDRLESEGRPAINITAISELLEDEDLLEMVSGGLLPWVVVDDYKADVFSKVFDNLIVRKDLVLRESGQLGWAFRKNSPIFAAQINKHVKTHKAGTMFGNMMLNRYLRDFKWVENALDAEDYGRFENVVEIFKKYGEQYGMDFLMVAAQGYQESKLDQSQRSSAGAVGIMQLLPSTAADSNVGIPDITTIDNNIHAGVKYLNFIRNRYFSDPGIDSINQTLLALAAYNAGPNKINQLRKMASSHGLDPNIWFGNVEIMAAKEVGREPVQYVSNIYKYYVTYSMMVFELDAREKERERVGIDER